VANPYAGAPAAPPPPPAYGASQPYGQGVASPPQGLSIASLVCGIAGVVLSFIWIGFPIAIAAVVLGHIAQRKKQPARAFWITGLITGYVGIAISLVWILIVLIGIILAASLGAGVSQY
jgi:hypothetical protein